MSRFLATERPDSLDSLFALAQCMAGGDAIRDGIVRDIYQTSRNICREAVRYEDPKKLESTYRLDKIVTSPIWGFPIMLAILGIVFW
ncbi:MAG: ferrous iron transporter B, partial [Brevibacillus sp.]